MDSFRRGEVWIVDLGLAAKVRPCLILSVPTLDQDRALVTVVPHTLWFLIQRVLEVRGLRFEVDVKVGFLGRGVFDAQNVVTIPQAKLLRKLGVLSTEHLSFVENAVRSWLGL
jgi:mRNA interferase MazF